MGLDKKSFQNPPMNCRSVPFWSWNGALSPEETRWQVRELVNKGMGGGFMHARFGLATEYMGKDWIANCAASIDEGKKLGFCSWLYDEDCWPSGGCSGQTAAVNPEFRARMLLVRRGNGEPLPAGPASKEDLQVLARFRVIEEPGKPPRFVKAHRRDEDTSDVITFFRTVAMAEGPNHECYADLLREDAVREFIRNTHEKYAKNFRREFGRAVPGIFTDEPQLRHGLPWSVRFAAEFRKRYGYDIVKRLPHLVFNTPESPKVRHDYWRVVHDLFDEAFMKQVGDWCRRNRLVLTGHLMDERTLADQVRAAGGCMHHYLHMGTPGVDILRERISEILTCKQVSSVANQMGQERVLSELYGCTGYTFTFEGQKWIGDWQMALGINLLSQHMTHYTLKGAAKRDYPPSYSYQTPWWRHYRHIADYQARLAYVLMQGRPVRDILLIHPLTSAWSCLEPLAPDGGRRVADMDRQLNEIMKALLDLHRDFDLGDELIMAKHASVKGTKLTVGQAAYSAVLVPPMANIESSTLDLLERFARSGGRLFFMQEIPELVGGVPSCRAQKLAFSDGACRISTNRKHIEEVLEVVLPRAVSVLSNDTLREATGVLCQERREGRATILFMANTNREFSAPITIRLRGRGAWEQWDCENGAVKPVPSTQAGEWSEVVWTLSPVGSVVLRRVPGKPYAAQCDAKKRAATVLNPRGGWSFRRMAPNSMPLDRCTWKLNDGPFSGPVFTSEAQVEWRRRLGLPTYGGSSSAAFQPWKLALDPNNLKAVAQVALRYPFAVDVLPKGEVFLVLEDRATTDIYVNGTLVETRTVGWFMDKSFEKVPILKFLKKGRNVVEVRAGVNAVRTMEDMYLVGEFGVDPVSFAITKEPKRLLIGDWCRQGYPFYSDAMMYERTVTFARLPKGRICVELSKFEGTVAAVWLNGIKVAVIGWRPYRADVTSHIKRGENALGIEIVGSPRNLMGPRHSIDRYPVWTGPEQFSDTSCSTYQLTPAGLTGDVFLLVHDQR